MCLTMKGMKDMKKAVAEFRASYIITLPEVAVQPFRLAHLLVWPKAKSLHVSSGSSWLSFFFGLYEPLHAHCLMVFQLSANVQVRVILKGIL